jgi:hypothetical protein
VCVNYEIDIYANKPYYSLSYIKLSYHIFSHLLSTPYTHTSYFYISIKVYVKCYSEDEQEMVYVKEEYL